MLFTLLTLDLDSSGQGLARYSFYYVSCEGGLYFTVNTTFSVSETSLKSEILERLTTKPLKCAEKVMQLDLVCYCPVFVSCISSFTYSLFFREHTSIDNFVMFTFYCCLFVVFVSYHMVILLHLCVYVSAGGSAMTFTGWCWANWVQLSALWGRRSTIINLTHIWCVTLLPLCNVVCMGYQLAWCSIWPLLSLCNACLWAVGLFNSLVQARKTLL